MNNLRLALLGLAAIAALFLGFGFLQRAFRGPQAPADTAVIILQPAVPVPTEDGPAVGAARRKVEAAIAATPDYARFFDKLRALFPGEYESILASLAREAGAAPQFPSADTLTADAIGALRKSDGLLAARASDDALGQIFVRQLDEMRALAQRDVHLCVAFLYGASGTGFLDFAAANRAMIADSGIAGLDAMHSGQVEQITRTAPSDGDFQLLERALTQKGLSRPEIETLLDGKTANPPIADDRMCAAGQSYLETLAGLEPGPRGRLYALAVNLLAKS